jgi:hypothetical protein
MNTWEMIKDLTENQHKQIFFQTTHDENEPIICFLRPTARSIEFRLFRTWDKNFISDSVILYPTNKWIQISKEDADVFLNNNYELL